IDVTSSLPRGGPVDISDATVNESANSAQNEPSERDGDVRMTFIHRTPDSKYNLINSTRTSNLSENPTTYSWADVAKRNLVSCSMKSCANGTSTQRVAQVAVGAHSGSAAALLEHITNTVPPVGKETRNKLHPKCPAEITVYSTADSVPTQEGIQREGAKLSGISFFYDPNESAINSVSKSQNYDSPAVELKSSESEHGCFEEKHSSTPKAAWKEKPFEHPGSLRSDINMSSGNAFELNAVGASGSRSGASVVVKNKGHLFLVHRMKQFWDHFMADGERQFLPFTYVAAYVPNSVDVGGIQRSCCQIPERIIKRIAGEIWRTKGIGKMCLPPLNKPL
ncbi:hypothetical protein Tcan_09685, partial [Toxocara canis]